MSDPDWDWERENIRRLNIESGHAPDCQGTPGYKGICNCGKDNGGTVQHAVRRARQLGRAEVFMIVDEVLRKADDEIRRRAAALDAPTVVHDSVIWTKDPPTGACWARLDKAVRGVVVSEEEPGKPRWVYFGDQGASLPDLVDNGYVFAPIRWPD